MTPREAPHVVVVGGGLAGLSAAIECLDRGARVSLFEARPRFGGATWSFTRNGLRFDNGQHVYLACCDAYRRFLDRLGTTHLAPLRRLSIPVLRPGADGSVTRAVIRRTSLPAPAHLAWTLATYRHLPLADRLRIGAGARALARLDLADPALDDETLFSFLSRHAQSPRAIAALWDLIALPTTNVRAEEVSLALAAKVFKTGLLSRADAADIGWADVPLAELHVDPALSVIEKAGGTVYGRAKVSALAARSGAVGELAGVVADGGELAADAVIVAVGHEAAADLLPDAAGVDLAGLRRLGTSPIIDVHVVYDRPVMEYPLAAGIDSPVQFVFDKSTAAGLAPGSGQCLAVSISGADAEHTERPEVLIERYTTALAALFPAARGATVRDAVVSREHAATFRGVPGTAALRPRVETAIANCFLAGTYTDTGWPATMEGAVRSGHDAASAAMAYLTRAGSGTRSPKEVVS
jgi:squalene-associated FAD-dependent desaturase